jgi:hypothetical protein
VGLRNVIAKSVDAAFTALGDIPLQATIRHYSGTPVRDPDTGVTSQPSTVYLCKEVTTDIKDLEGRGNVLDGDQNAIVRYNEVPAVEVGDIYTKADGTVWEVLGDNPDPTTTIHQLHIRKKKVTRT